MGLDEREGLIELAAMRTRTPWVRLGHRGTALAGAPELDQLEAGNRLTREDHELVRIPLVGTMVVRGGAGRLEPDRERVTQRHVVAHLR